MCRLRAVLRSRVSSKQCVCGGMGGNGARTVCDVSVRLCVDCFLLRETPETPSYHSTQEVISSPPPSVFEVTDRKQHRAVEDLFFPSSYLPLKVAKRLLSFLLEFTLSPSDIISFSSSLT